VDFKPRPASSFQLLAAPEMRECREATIKDLGLWDDALRFEHLDFILIRRQDALFSYSLVTGDLKKIHSAPNMSDSRLVDGMTWGKHQWVFLPERDGHAVLPLTSQTEKTSTSRFLV